VLLLVDMAYLVFLAYRESRGQSVREWFIMFSIIYWGYLSGFSNEHYQRAAHSIDATLHSLSDTQLVASIGLLSLCSTRAAISRHTTTTSCATCFSCLWSHIRFVSIPHFFKRTSGRHSSDYLVSSLPLFSLGFCAKAATFRDFQWT
jgi:hypothetical protein